MSRDEWLGWQAYWHLEPWGCLPADQRAEYQLQMAFAIAAKPGTAIPRFIERDPEPIIQQDPTPEELDEKVRDFFAGFKTVRLMAEPKPPRMPRKTAEQAPPAK
jgi:hypothetical protein